MGFCERRGLVILKCDVCAKERVFSRDDSEVAMKEGWIWGKAFQNKIQVEVAKNFASCNEHEDEVLSELNDDWRIEMRRRMLRGDFDIDEMLEDSERNKTVDAIIEQVRNGQYERYGDYKYMTDVKLRSMIIEKYDRLKRKEVE